MMTEEDKITKIDYKVIDDFLPQKVFRPIQSEIMNEGVSDGGYQTLSWAYSSTVASNDDDPRNNLILFFHMIYHEPQIQSPFYEQLIPIFEKLNFKSLMRCKINLYPNTEKVYEHEMHRDFDFSHKTALLSINTCDGYTKLEDGTKIDSVANRMLLFDASKPHLSTTCSNSKARFNINFNYF